MTAPADGARRLAVLAHYDPRGRVGPHVRRQAEALAEAVDDLVIVSTAPLDDASRAWLGQRGRLVERSNYGYDFFSYRTGLEAVDPTAYDEVVLCNDTYVGPLVPYPEMFAEMAARPVDFWGLSASERISPHLQSFFVAFRPWVVSSRAFRTFWADMAPISARSQVINRYEVGLTTTLAEAGFGWAAYFHENDADRRLARRRVRWWQAHRVPLPRSRSALAALREKQRVPWNPAIGLADCALDAGRLPYVKIDTLRYDPYALGADRLLTLCERAEPTAFEGVRGFLADTAADYPPRPQGTLRPTPVALRPLRHLVEYGRAV